MSAGAREVPRIVLFGHGIVGQEALAVLIGMGYEVTAVFAHAPTPGDWQVGLAEEARRYAIPCFVDAKFDAPETVAIVAAAAPDLIVSAYCRELLPAALLACARLGGVNLHGSPLPHYRGRAPVNWMVLRGEVQGGVSLHQMTARADRGPLLGVTRFPIGVEDTAFDVLLNVRREGGNLLRHCLPGFLTGTLTPTAQGKGSMFGRRTPADGRIDWSWSASRIHCLVRALTRPYPGAFADLGEERVVIWWATLRAEIVLEPGVSLPRGRSMLVGTGTHALALLDYQVTGAASGNPTATPAIR